MKNLRTLCLASVLFLVLSPFTFADAGKFSCYLRQEETALSNVELVEGAKGEMSATIDNPSAVYSVALEYLAASDEKPARLKIDFATLTNKSVEKDYRILTSSVTVGASSELVEVDLDAALSVHCFKR